MINHITLTNYRNIAQAKFLLDNHTIIIAPNGSGKTNVLESIYYTLYGTSFKSIDSNADVIGSNDSFARVVLQLDNSEIESVTSQSDSGTLTRVFKKNNKKVALRTIPNDIIALVFAPTSVDLVDGSPDIRRKDLDQFIIGIQPNFSRIFTRYSKVLKNKNALLKQIQDPSHSQKRLAFWNEELAKLGEQIVYERINAINQINELAQSIYAELYKNADSFEITYHHHRQFDMNEYAQSLLKKYTDNIEKEIIVGQTLYGPHKDDFEVNLNNKPIRYFGSRGQQRIATLIIKLGQMKEAYARHKKPILLIDDIFSELDNQHRKNIARYFKDYHHQIIITSANINEIPVSVTNNAKVITLDD